MLPVHDNYWSDGWNYYLYDHPTRGFLFIPNDIDMPWHDDESQPIIPRTAAVPGRNGARRPGLAREVRRRGQARDRGVRLPVFDARIDRWWAQIAAVAAEDPHVVYTKGDAEELRSRVHARSDGSLGVAGDPASW